jgi:hypothetical protein
MLISLFPGRQQKAGAPHVARNAGPIHFSSRNSDYRLHLPACLPSKITAIAPPERCKKIF